MCALYVALEAGHKDIAALIYAKTTAASASDSIYPSSSIENSINDKRMRRSASANDTGNGICSKNPSTGSSSTSDLLREHGQDLRQKSQTEYNGNGTKRNQNAYSHQPKKNEVRNGNGTTTSCVVQKTIPSSKTGTM